jgi:hypothetical protein
MERVIVAFDEVGRVTDPDLIARLRRLVRADRTLSARLLVHLAEVDARGLYREYACASMFTYCVEELHMSEAEAYLRIQAARLGRQFPLIVQLFANGSLHLTAIKLLGPHLTPENHVQLLERASGKNKREIELLVATLAPRPKHRSHWKRPPRRRQSLQTEHPSRWTRSSRRRPPPSRAASCRLIHAAQAQSLQAPAHRRAGSA